MCNVLTTNEWEIKESAIIKVAAERETIWLCHHFNRNKKPKSFYSYIIFFYLQLMHQRKEEGTFYINPTLAVSKIHPTFF